MTAAAGAGESAAALAVREANSADRDAWDAFVAAHPASDQLQEWGWGEVADAGGERPVRLLGRDAAGRVAAVAQLLVRDTSFGRRVVYVPHGPLWTATERLTEDEALDGILATVRERAVQERAIVVKLDPRAPFPDRGTSGDAPQADGGAGSRSAPRASQPSADAIASSLLRRGLRPALDLQARTTRILDLRAGEEALLASFEKDTRNLIRRSEREGVVARVVRDDDPAAYARFADLLAATGERAGFHTRTGRELSTLATQFTPKRRAYLVLAELSGNAAGAAGGPAGAIAGCLAIRVAERAFYLYAGSLRDRELRHANGAYAALWALCRALVADGVAWLDLWGVIEPDDTGADPSWAGFSLFKRGFGGTPLRHPGTFDLVVSPLWYRIRDWRERRLVRRARG